MEFRYNGFKFRIFKRLRAKGSVANTRNTKTSRVVKNGKIENYGGWGREIKQDFEDNVKEFDCIPSD